MLSIESVLLTVGVLLFAGIVASRLSDWLGVPSLLLFLAIGMLASSEGLGSLVFDSTAAAQAADTVGLLIPQRPVVLHTRITSDVAAAICEAGSRPRMRFVPIKSVAQQDMQAL